MHYRSITVEGIVDYVRDALLRDNMFATRLVVPPGHKAGEVLLTEGTLTFALG